ncbi:kinesin-2b-like isoform X4 [Palaemon carinicauda]|uniref:kinesin-2b-like isoform X4 n=1 Tax=Palaemon carinicauda TaxID=392227 RepID=UPI0035B5DB1F
MVERKGGRREDSPQSRESLGSSGLGSSGGSEGGLSGSRVFTGHSTLPSSSEGFGSASSLDSTMRSLGSRGSLCDEGYDDCDNINVVVRCRPLNDKERKKGDETCVTFPGEGQVWVNMDGMNGQATQKPKVFTYNVVFEPEAIQEDILEHSGVKRLLDMSIDGFSCTVFCYGQTGSGKTHTLTGPPHLYYKDVKPSITTARTATMNHPVANFFSFDKGPLMYSEEHGLIFRSFVYLFSQLETRDDQEFTLTASYLEIYNEKAIDLLNIGTNQKPLQVRWSKKKRGFFVENLFEIECAELDDLLAVLEEGLRNRAVASHNMNEYSSRSHTILTVNITSEQKADDGVYVTRNGKINFVDLAGSEMTKKTNSEGKTLEEANNINKSLMVLGTCIAALSDSRKRDGHVPYRDSKLTKLLADSLAGNGVTLMIACVSPAKSNISETINTLRYASRAKRIRTKPIIIMDPKEKVIMSLQREVSLLREENAHLKMLLDIAAVDGVPNGTGEGINGETDAEGNIIHLKGAGEMNGANIASKTGVPVHPTMPSRQGSFRVDKDKLASLDNGELINLVQQYMIQHENVMRENKELQAVTAALARDQDLVCKENERLLRKLEDVSSVCRRSPIIPAQPMVSGDEILNASMTGNYKALNGILSGRNSSQEGSAFRSRSLPSSSSSSQVWINPLNDSSRGRDVPTTSGSAPGSSGSRLPHRLPESINKELEKRRIGKSLNDLTGSGSSGRDPNSRGGRRNSWENGQDDTVLPSVRKPTVKHKNMSPGMGPGKSGLRAKNRSKSVPRPRVRGKVDNGRGNGEGGPDRRPPEVSSPGSSPQYEVNPVPPTTGTPKSVTA